MKSFHKTLSISALVLLIGAGWGCKKEDEATPAEMLVGKWNITSSEILNSTVPGDGSYLRFNACGSATCDGTDYMASDNTTGSITYELNAEATSIVINDTSSNGGSYNATWDVLELTEAKFRMTTNTGLFGNMTIEMEKLP